MTHPAVELTRAFYAFERRGRGGDRYEHPVRLEPAFVPIAGKHREDLAYEPEEAEFESRLSFSLTTTPEYRADMRTTERYLRTLGTLRGPLSFECLRLAGKNRVLWSVLPEDKLFLSVLAAEPGIELHPSEGIIEETEQVEPESYFRTYGLALGREWMLPLGESPVLPDLLSLFDGLEPSDGLIFQLLIAPTTLPWQDAAKRALFTHRGEPFFDDDPDFVKNTARKLEEPLFAVSARLISISRSPERLGEILAPTLGVLNGAGGHNTLLPVATNPDLEILALKLGLSFRTGMLLSPPELAALVHVPEGALVPREALPAALGYAGIEIGRLAGREPPERVSLPLEARLRHTHLIGASGTGKSTLLLRMILSDIEAGYGVALLDPHGDLTDSVLALLPESERERLIVFDPADPDYVLGFNPLEARSEREREILASDLVAVLRRLSTSWGDQMSAVLSYALLALLSGSGGNLEDLRRFLSRREERTGYLTDADPFVREFFERDFTHLKGRPEAPILTRLNTLLRVPLLREVFLEERRTLDLGEVIREKRVLLCRLSKGAIGSENAALLASLLITKLHQAAFMRDALPEEKRHPFFVYIDEVHECLSPSLAEIFSGARKYGLALTVAHQNTSQIEGRERETLRSLLANAYTRIAFRLGEEDARILSRSLRGFGPDELVDLETGEAVIRSGRARDTALIETDRLPKPSEAARVRGRQIARDAQRRHASPRILEEGPPVRDEEKPHAPKEGKEEEVRRRSPPTVSSTEFERDREEPEPREEITEPTPGHGGAEHRYLQGLVSEWGKSRGFQVRLEEIVLDGRGRVDVGLHKEDRSIAVEIAVSTDPVHESQNIRKCLEAGFDEVVVVSTNGPFLKTLSEEFGDEKKIHLLSPQELFSFLQGEPEEVGKVAGYRVKVVYDEEGKRGQSSPITEIIMRNIKRLREKK